MSDANRRRPEVVEILALIDGFGGALHSQDLAASMELLDPALDLAVIPSEGVDVHLGHDAVAAFLTTSTKAPVDMDGAGRIGGFLSRVKPPASSR